MKSGTFLTILAVAGLYAFAVIGKIIYHPPFWLTAAMIAIVCGSFVSFAGGIQDRHYLRMRYQEEGNRADPPRGWKPEDGLTRREWEWAMGQIETGSHPVEGGMASGVNAGASTKRL